jgi:hypothetical protein
VPSRRPRRGDPGPNVIVTGDEGRRPDDEGSGTEAGPQGGARTDADVYRESGDLHAREFGVPQADLPGGIRHVINPETHPDQTAPKPERPADYHKYHGVPSDDGQYLPVPDEAGIHLSDWPKPEPVPKTADAIPVYIVERGSAGRDRRVADTDTILLPAVGTDPARICGQDDSRDEIMLLVTAGATTPNALISDDRSSLADATVTSHGRAAFLSASATTYTRIATQAELWGTSDSATPVLLSVIIITTIAA